MATKIISGNQIQLFYQGETFAYATSHTLSITGNTTDSNNKDTGVFGSTDVTSITWEVTGDYFYTDYDYDRLFDLMLYRRPIMVEVSEVRNYSDKGLISTGGDTASWVASPITRRGYAVITSLNTTANTSENATYSITFTGAGPLKTIDNTTTDYSIKVTYNDDIEGMTLFNMRAYPFINSAWVVPEGGRPVQIDMSDGKLHDATPNTSYYFIYYLSGPAIPEYMFSGVNTVATVEATNTIYNVGQYAFNNCSLTEISIPGPNPINYGNYCFSNCTSLTHVNYDSGNGRNWLFAKHVNNSSFLNCVRLVDSVLGDACEYILMSAFDGCLAMRNVWFGSSLRRVNDRAFLVDSHASTKTFHFYTEKAPYCQELAFGNIGYQTFILHNAASVNDFISGTDMDTYYPTDQCEYRIEV